jgi:hypothetical protein
MTAPYLERNLSIGIPTPFRNQKSTNGEGFFFFFHRRAAEGNNKREG